MTDPSAAAVEAVNRGVALMGQYDYDAAVKAFEEALDAIREAARWYEKVSGLGFGVNAWY